MKKDYAYIALLDDNTTNAIKDIQTKLNQELGYSVYGDQWPPHITISFGNLLTDQELVQVQNLFSDTVKDIEPFKLKFKNYQIMKREINGNSFFSLRLKISDSDILDKLSERVTFVAKKFEVPFDVFTKDHYHVGLGRYNSLDLSDEKIKEIINIDILPEITINSFSVFHSMENNPKPDKVTEIERYFLIS